MASTSVHDEYTCAPYRNGSSHLASGAPLEGVVRHGRVTPRHTVSASSSPFGHSAAPLHFCWYRMHRVAPLFGDDVHTKYGETSDGLTPKRDRNVLGHAKGARPRKSGARGVAGRGFRSSSLEKETDALPPSRQFSVRRPPVSPVMHSAR